MLLLNDKPTEVGFVYAQAKSQLDFELVASRNKKASLSREASVHGERQSLQRLAASR